MCKTMTCLITGFDKAVKEWSLNLRTAIQNDPNGLHFSSILSPMFGM